MKSVVEDKLTITEQFVDEMYFCLDCQACETVCPAGVRYGALVENARAVIARNTKDPLALRVVKTFFLNFLLTSKRRLRWVTRLMWLYQRSGLRDAVDRSGILSLVSERVHEKHSLVPHVSAKAFDETVPEVLEPFGKKKGTVCFLSGCIMNVALGEIHNDAIYVLRACGYEVIVPKLQECCGSLHSHNGEMETAKELARRNLDVFERYSFDAFIVDSAGCGAFLKEYGEVFAGDESYAERAGMFSMKVRDITEFLAGIDLPPMFPVRKKVTYHEACHLVHTQKVSSQPRKLIQSVPGIEFVELPEATWCCGSAGIYNVVRFEDSMKLLGRKMENLAATHADIVLTANPGCHLQLQYGIKKFGLKMKVMHPVSLLKECLKP